MRKSNLLSVFMFAWLGLLMGYAHIDPTTWTFWAFLIPFCIMNGVQRYYVSKEAKNCK